MPTLARLFSNLARLGLAGTVALLVLAISGWAPVYARPPLVFSALPLAGLAILFAILAALTARERRRTRWRVVALILAGVVVGLLGTVALRGPSGLRAEVSGPEGVEGRTDPGPIDVLGRDLRDFAGRRRWTIRWAGTLRVPESGRYRLSVQGRGRARVSLDGHVLLEAEGDPLAGAVDVGLARGTQDLEVVLELRGRGPRLRLGWTRPDGGTEVIPPRLLGPPRAAWVWWLTDALALAAAVLAGLLVFLAPWERPRRPPSPQPVTVTEIGVSILGYALLLGLMSWPLARDLVHTGPVDRPDGRLNAWILAWGGSTLFTEPGRVFQAPAFHPLPDALAFSENLLLPAAAVAPLEAIGGPFLAYNLALLGSLLLSGLGVQLLVRRVSGDRLAAFVAGAYFAAGPHRWTRLSHLHAQVTVFLPLALLALECFWARRSLRRALVVGLMVALQGLSSVYLGVITATAVSVAALVALFGGLRPRELLKLGLGFLLAGAILWPVAHPYLRMRAFQGVEFTMETVAGYAATLPSYVAAGTLLWGRVTNRHLPHELIRDTLFPGLTILVLGVAGLAVAPRRYRAVALATSAAAIILSLGPETAIYRFLHEHLVLLRGVRALSRFALVPVLAVSVLAGLALAGRRRLVVLGALVLMMAESVNLPLRLGRYPGPSAAAQWLAGKEGAVLHLPLATDDTRVMLDGLAHRRPLVNGDSGFMPRPFDRAMELLDGPLGEEGRRFLRAVDVSHVVARGPIDLPEVAAFEGERVFDLPPGAMASVVSAAEPVATRWTPSGAFLDLGEAQRVDALVFELSDGPWVAAPRIEASVDGIRWERLETEASLADATLSLYQDPRHARGEVRFRPRDVRYLKVDPRLPARPGLLEIGR
jgi:hypothetical protein